jgi:hypothetical protein
MKDDADDNDDIGRLLRAAGPRAEPSPETLRRLRAAAHDEWQATLRRRTRLRYMTLAASLLGVVGGSFLFMTARPVTPVVIARVIHGGELLNVVRHAAATDPELLAVGDRVTTSGAGALLAHLPGGITTLRLDRDTSVELVAPDELRLLQGRLYVDTGLGTRPNDAARNRLVIAAAGARIQHVGTQFLTSLERGTVTVGVRDGLVRVALGSSSADLARGELATIDAGRSPGSGAIVRGRVATSGGDWEWADALAPRLPIEGRRLVDVLRALAYQSGLSLSFASEAIEAEATATILHGPALDMRPAAALRAILGTTAFAPAVTGEDADRIVIDRR